MAYERKPGDIAIFAEKPKKSDKAPDWKGTLITPDGQTLEVSLWAKGSNGTMLAGSVQVPRQRQDEGERFHKGGSGGVSGGGGRQPEPNDEIPF